MIETGKLNFHPQMKDAEQIKRELSQIKKTADGQIDIESCSPLVRSLARTMFLVDNHEVNQASSEPEPEPVSSEKLIGAQREYLNLLNDLFEGAHKCKVSSIANHADFIKYSKANVESIARELERRMPDVIPKLGAIYGQLLPMCSGYAKSAASTVQLVAGGGSRLLETQISSIRKVVLYSDCVYIPDPVMPWIESERKEERFRHVEMLRSIYAVLRFKPLVDANMPRPAVVFFPSFEKSLEERDVETQDATGRLFMDVMGYYLERRFEDEQEVFVYARDNPAQFLAQVDRHSLYLAPGGSPRDSLLEAIASHKRHRAEMMSSEAVEKYNNLPDSVFVAIAIMERLQPQHHLMENAKMLVGQPLLTNAAASHYYSKCAKAFSGNLLERNLLSQETISTLDALADSRFDWMANIPLSTLAELRENGENEQFRSRLSAYTSRLGDSAMNDLDVVARSVASGLQGLVEQHARDVKDMKSRWAKKYTLQAVESWVGLGASFVPLLGPYLSTLVGGDVLKQYLMAKKEERDEAKATSQSLAGVLAESFTVDKRS